MPTFSFGPWRPDLPPIAELGDDGQLRLTEAINVVPDVDCYQPQQQGTIRSSSLTLTCQGAFACADENGNINWFAGTASKLRRISSNTATWSTVGAGYALTAEDRWEFAQYGNQVFATAVTNDLQFMTMSAGSSFAAVGGAPPRFRHIAVVRNFMVGASTATAPQRVQWSGLDNPQTWTVNATTQADFQDLLGPGGWNTGIVVGLAGADAVVFQERAVWRMMYVNVPLVFQFDPVESARGAIAPGSIVQSAGFAFYYADDGFYQFDGTTSTPIGLGKVDTWFATNVDAGFYDRITSAADADRPLVFWSFRSVDGSVPDYMLVYNWQVQEWSLVSGEHELVWRALTRHTTPFGAPRLALFSTAHRAITLDSGSNKSARITTAQYQFNPAGRSLITEVYPLVEEGSPRTDIMHRPNSTTTLSNEVTVTMNAQGFAPFRVDDRLMAIRTYLSLGASWAKWRGVKINPRPTGVR